MRVVHCTACVLFTVQHACCSLYSMRVVHCTACVLFTVQHACCSLYSMHVVHCTACMLFTVQHACCTLYSMPSLHTVQCSHQYIVLSFACRCRHAPLHHLHNANANCALVCRTYNTEMSVRLWVVGKRYQNSCATIMYVALCVLHFVFAGAWWEMRRCQHQRVITYRYFTTPWSAHYTINPFGPSAGLIFIALVRDHWAQLVHTHNDCTCFMKYMYTTKQHTRLSLDNNIIGIITIMTLIILISQYQNTQSIK